MIRPFEAGDEYRLIPNEHSHIDDILHVFSDDLYEKYALEDDGRIVSIMLWIESEPRRFAAFFLMSEDVRPKHTKAMKRFINRCAKQFMAKSCLTYSVNCDMINRWHRFLGFDLEESGVLINNKFFNKWVLTWD